jgi:hypothetical protein
LGKCILRLRELEIFAVAMLIDPSAAPAATSSVLERDLTTPVATFG